MIYAHTVAKIDKWKFARKYKKKMKESNRRAELYDRGEVH